MIMLTLPAIPAGAARTRQFQANLGHARQLVRHVTLRARFDPYYCRLSLIARLLYFVVGDLGNAMTLLFNNPQQLILTILSNVNKPAGPKRSAEFTRSCAATNRNRAVLAAAVSVLMGFLSALVGRGDRPDRTVSNLECCA